MERPDKYSSFVSDILNLYCRTGLKSIEDIFVRLSQSEDSVYFNWLISNKSMSDNIERPDVYSALLSLLSIKRKFEPPIKFPELIKFFMDTKNKESRDLAVIVKLSSFLTNKNVNALLIPFRDILVMCSKLKTKDEEDTSSILNSLLVINNGFNQFLEKGKSGKTPAPEPTLRPEPSPQLIKPTMQSRKVQMFSMLLQKFSNEIAEAADRWGLRNFAGDLRSGCLLKPIELSKHITVRVESEHINEANRILKYMGHGSSTSQVDTNYNFIKERALFFTGHVDQKALMELYKKREQSKDLSHYMDPAVGDKVFLGGKPTTDTISVNDSQLLDPSYISLLLAFFTIYYNKITR